MLYDRKRMSHARYVLAIDQGTTSTRAIVFDGRARAVASARRELKQYYPASGWVEHDAEDIWRDTLAAVREVLERTAGGVAGIAALGITNQRETVVIWERDGGKPIHRAIVWQDRRTADACAELRAAGAEPLVRSKTGLLLDPYFSGTKVAWLLDHVAGARERAERGELAFGTIDSFLLWRLTGGRMHATDVTNASRTLLFDIHAQCWDEELLALLRVPRPLLPQVRDSSEVYGATEAALFGRALPVAGIAGDQQAALIGQACFTPGMAKSTYGTGCFLLLNTGETAVTSGNRMLTTPAYRIGGRITYAMEGSIFVAGAAIKWLRDGLKVIRDAAETACCRGARAGRSRCVPGAGVRGARGAVLGAVRPRADLWPDAGCLGRSSRARGARVGGFSDTRSHRGHAARWRAPCAGHPRRWRHGGK